MSRYIDKDKILDNLNWFAPEPHKDSISSFIEEQPEADVVEVVRCKDCMWWEKQNDSLQGRCVLLGSYPTGNWYCANGERKE